MRYALPLTLVAAVAFAVLAVSLYVAGAALRVALGAVVILAVVGYIVYRSMRSRLRLPRGGPPAPSP